MAKLFNLTTVASAAAVGSVLAGVIGLAASRRSSRVIAPIAEGAAVPGGM